jgi:hypothetical protein
MKRRPRARGAGKVSRRRSTTRLREPASTGEHADAQVLFRSGLGEGVRFTIGVAFALAGWLLAGPVLVSGKAPPAPAALFIGLDTETGTLHPLRGSLEMAIHAPECKNPATVEGVLTIPASSWHAYERQLTGPRPRGPTQAELVLDGVKLQSGRAGLASEMIALPSANARPSSGQTISGLAQVYTPSGRMVTLHSTLSPVLRWQPTRENEKEEGTIPVAGLSLIVPQWPETRFPLHFVLQADLVRPDGFHRCFVDVPEIMPSLSASLSAFGTAEGFPTRQQPNQPRASIFPVADEVGSAQVSVNIGQHVAESGSLASGVASPGGGARFTCSSRTSNETCSATPVFELPDTGGDVTTRLFFAGILGALAATLIVEAMTYAITDSLARRSSRR